MALNILKPTVGPIVGHTTDAAARIFIRGDAVPLVDGSLARCFGVISWRSEDSEWQAPLVTELRPGADDTCVFELTGLRAETVYEYRAGWFIGPAPQEEIESLTTAAWGNVDTHVFGTGTANRVAPRTFAVGSCRYLASPLEPEYDLAGDMIFGSIRALHAQQRFDALLLLGDQIYADTLLPWFSARQLGEFHRLYRCAFTHPHLARLMASVPTYMTLDDHEIEDNWPAYASNKDKTELFPNAMAAYRTYQRGHGPAGGTAWYEFEDGCAEWFVMDTRSERDIGAERMVSDGQLQALLQFLERPGGGVKLVATSVPIFPDHAEHYEEDKWQGFLGQRRAIFDRIRDRRIQKVVFVSGDVHCSFAARLQLSADTAVHTIVSSPLVSVDLLPTDVIREESFVREVLHTDALGLPQRLTSRIFTEDSFARLAVLPDHMLVSFYDRDLQPLQENVRIGF